MVLYLFFACRLAEILSFTNHDTYSFSVYMRAKRESNPLRFGKKNCKERGPDSTLILILLPICSPFPFCGVCVFVEEKWNKILPQDNGLLLQCLKSDAFRGNLLL